MSNSRYLEIPFSGVSMEPFLTNGDRLYVDTKASHLKIGDIVVIKDETNEIICHRIVSLIPLMTKGDRNLYIDNEGKLIGVLIKVFRNNKTIHTNSNRFINKIQAYLCLKNNKKNPFRKLFLLFLFLLSLLETKISIKNNVYRIQ